MTQEKKDWTPERCPHLSGSFKESWKRCNRHVNHDGGCFATDNDDYDGWTLLAEARQKLAEVEEELDNEKDLEENSHRRYERAEKERLALAARITEIQHERDGLREKLDKAEVERNELLMAVSGVRSERDALRAKLSERDDSEPCPSCVDHVHELEAELEASRETSRDYAEQRDKAEANFLHEKGFSDELVTQRCELVGKLQRTRKDRNRWRKVAMRLVDGGAS